MSAGCACCEVKGHVWFGVLRQSQDPCLDRCRCVHREDGDSGRCYKDSVSLLLKKVVYTVLVGKVG